MRLRGRVLWRLAIVAVYLVVQVGGRASRGTPCPTDAAGAECSGHGLCRRGRCLCDPGYSGGNCAPKREPPGIGRARNKDPNARPKYGRAYADQLKQDLASEMERRRAENDDRMRKLRDQFREQNKNIEQASSSVKEKLENARIENAAHIEEMQEQRSVEVEEIAKNTERIRESVDGVGAGLKEQLKAEYDAVANQAQKLSDKSKDDYVEPPKPPEIWDGEELPYSLDLYLTASEDLYEVVQLDLDEDTLYEDDGWEAYREMVLKRRADGGGSGSVTLDEVGPDGGFLANDEAAAVASLGAKMPPPPPPRPPPLPRNPPPPPPPQALERHASADTYDVVEIADDEDDDFL